VADFMGIAASVGISLATAFGVTSWRMGRDATRLQQLTDQVAQLVRRLDHGDEAEGGNIRSSENMAVRLQQVEQNSAKISTVSEQMIRLETRTEERHNVTTETLGKMARDMEGVQRQLGTLVGVLNRDGKIFG
jgi:hypothetical protein